MASENRDWGYDRIAGALANLGHEVSDQTVGNVLRCHGLPPAPERKRTTTWAAFIRTHLALLVGTDFFTAEVLTLRGLVTYYVLFFIHLESRQVDIAVITVHPDEPWMKQIARNVAMADCGALRDCRYLLHDRDTKFTRSFQAILASGQVEPLALPAHSPNLNAYAERWVFGERSLRRALSNYADHFHAERNHQGKGNVLLFPRATDQQREGPMRCRERLGGLLRYYHQEAASCCISRCSFLTYGMNDIIDLEATPGSSLGDALHLAGQIVQANLDLAHTAFDQGIDTVIFDTVPATTFLPLVSHFPPGSQAIGDAAVDAVNLGLRASALELRHQGYDVRIVDIARMADEVRTDPGTFGFLNVDQPVLLGDAHGVVFSPNPDAPPIAQAAFWDVGHPTTNLHGVFGAFSAESLTSHTDFRGDGNDVIVGTARDDFVLAGAGNDHAQFGAGDDIMFGGLGNDVAEGGAGSDLISGGAGNDRLSGGAGADVLAGNAGNDWLEGNAGNDALIDGLGSDRLSGGAGNDSFFTTQAQILGGNGIDSDRFDGGAGVETLAVLLDPATLAIEQANIAAHFVPGHDFTFRTMDLKITGIERIVLTTEFGFTDVPLPGELGERIHQADLFGLI